MVIFEDLQNKKEKLCVVGLGYVGLPLAIHFSQHFSVIGFDINSKRVEELKNNFDRTKEVKTEDLQKADIKYTDNQEDIKTAKFIIIAVPTPIKEGNLPDMSLVLKASETVAKNLTSGSVVVYESTVYPGATEEECLPVLEKFSGLKAGSDFKIGYSPERVNPGDKEHTIDKIIKVVSGMDKESLDLIGKVYSSFTKIFPASSIKVAEAAKVIENTQRDLNIALMNELAIIFGRMGFSIYDVLEASGTKWNFLPFAPGMVGGHCIGVDPYYLTFKAQTLGHHPEVVLAGRRINDSMSRYIARQIIKKATKINKIISSLRVAILGFTFKENIPDIRNSKVFDLYKEFIDFGLKPMVFDPQADREEVKNEYNVELCDWQDLKDLDIIILAVPHQEFLALSVEDYHQMLNKDKMLIADIKHILNKQEVESLGINYWTL